MNQPEPALVLLLCCCLASRSAAQVASGRFPAADSAAVRAVRAASQADVFVLEPAREAGADRLVALLARVPPGIRVPPSLHACVQPLGAAAARPRCIVLPTPGVAPSDEPFTTDSVVVEDLDGDGSAELRVAVSYQGDFVSPGIGTDFRRLFVVDVVPLPRVAFVLETFRFVMSTGQTTRHRITYQDVSGDGHLDIVAGEESCEDEEGRSCSPVTTRVYVWSRATGRWTPALRGR